MVSVLAIGPKVRRFKLGREDGFLRAIKILSIPEDYNLHTLRHDNRKSQLLTLLVRSYA
jgi:hypothetical protein